MTTKTMKFLLSNALTTSIVLLVLNTHSVDADMWGKSVNEQAVSLNELQSFWVDAMDVLSNLDSYDKLWIKPHSCVWSECAVDDTDDGYMGDNRDGDEQWYQYRTQGFCANAAYSLYGRKKDDRITFRGCTRRHFINSFFTYGGADTLLKSIGETPVTYSYNGDADDDANYGNDDNYDGFSANAACVEIEFEGSDDHVTNNEENDEEASGSNDNDEYSGTLGCSPDGKYVIAAFQSSSCDGNYFSGIVNDFQDYNDQHNAIGCHKIYDGNMEVSVDYVQTLLSNSWSCDLRLYPNGCPDPYGEKEKFDFAMRTVAHGGNPYLAYKNMVLKSPIHIASWALLALTLLVFIITYIIKNESRAIQSKGGMNLMGFLRCVGEDILIGFRQICSWIAQQFYSLTKNEPKRASGGKDSPTTNDSDNDSCDGYVHVEEDVENKATNHRGKKKKGRKSFTAPSVLVTTEN